MKSYTDLEQSKKLAEFLPLESADMFLAINGTIPVMSKYIDDGFVTADDTAIPCWSLTALLDVLPIIDDEFEPQLHKSLNKYRCTYEGKKDTCSGLWRIADNPVDACYKMIVKLHEQNLI
jgi:hypothetical protein